MTSDGCRHEPGENVPKGLPCAGVVHPLSDIKGQAENNFDVIVIGAGYCGLTAARDLCLDGESRRRAVQSFYFLT